MTLFHRRRAVGGIEGVCPVHPEDCSGRCYLDSNDRLTDQRAAMGLRSAVVHRDCPGMWQCVIEMASGGAVGSVNGPVMQRMASARMPMTVLPRNRQAAVRYRMGMRNGVSVQMRCPDHGSRRRQDRE